MAVQAYFLNGPNAAAAAPIAPTLIRHWSKRLYTDLSVHFIFILFIYISVAYHLAEVQPVRSKAGWSYVSPLGKYERNRSDS